MIQGRAEIRVLSAENKKIVEKASPGYLLSPQHSVLSTGVRLC